MVVCVGVVMKSYTGSGQANTANSKLIKPALAHRSVPGGIIDINGFVKLFSVTNINTRTRLTAECGMKSNCLFSYKEVVITTKHNTISNIYSNKSMML